MPCCGEGRRAAATAVKARLATVTAPVAATTVRPAPRPARVPAVLGPSGAPTSPDPRTAVAPRPAKPALPDAPAVLVRSLARMPLRVVGAATGRSYDFRSASAVCLVAREDAVTLLSSPSFRLV
jgi:hypothetical protein